MLAEMPL